MFSMFANVHTRKLNTLLTQTARLILHSAIIIFAMTIAPGCARTLSFFLFDIPKQIMLTSCLLTMHVHLIFNMYILICTNVQNA